MNLFKILFRLSRKVPGVNCLLRVLYHCDIPRKTKIGKGVKLGHNGAGVVIHPKTIIEDEVFIQHHVTAGVRFSGDECPVLRKNCCIGAYAIILGPVEIGENSVIGAGAIVTHDVPPNSVFYNKKTDVIKNAFIIKAIPHKDM